MRLRHVRNANEIIEAHRDLVIDNPESLKGRWKESIGGETSRLSVEIGCGKGTFLFLMSQEYENDSFIGIEMMSSVICRAVQKLTDEENEKEIKNVRLLNKDGSNITDYFEKGEIDRIYINFPDPWPKAKHAKRRLTSPGFLEKYKEILSDDGILRLKTDNVALFEYSKETMIPVLDNPSYGEVDYSTPHIQTEFETKFRNQGNPIYFIEGKFKR